MRFCPHCGAPVVPAGKFCVECGRQLTPSARGGIRGLPLTAAFVGVFLAILIVGLVVVYLIVPGTPTPPQMAALSQEAPPAAAQQPPADQGLPPGHPKVELPDEARKFIEQVQKDADAKPSDIAAWNKLGDVLLRASMLDPSYSPRAQAAYAHSLKLDPDNPDGLRGLGNLDFDRKNYDQAIAAYEHYLKERPDDPEVRTDLGTMYLYTNNPDQAVVQYKRAIKLKPEFFEAYFNMGIAYGDQNDAADARQSLQHALKLAPDDDARSKVNEVMAKIAGAPKEIASASTATAKAKPDAPAPAGADASPGGFHDDVEDMVRNIPFAGPKVQAVKWPENLKAMVLMNNCPTDEMPPFAKQKFLSDLRDGIKTAKNTHNIKDPVVVDITNGATGEVMETVSQ
jgi:cytochrome c-type biogenesis protein CcmH/NrfG